MRPPSAVFVNRLNAARKYFLPLQYIKPERIGRGGVHVARGGTVRM